MKRVIRCDMKICIYSVAEVVKMVTRVRSKHLMPTLVAQCIDHHTFFQIAGPIVTGLSPPNSNFFHLSY
jgi:hypothetical protein